MLEIQTKIKEALQLLVEDDRLDFSFKQVGDDFTIRYKKHNLRILFIDELSMVFGEKSLKLKDIYLNNETPQILSQKILSSLRYKISPSNCLKIFNKLKENVWNVECEIKILHCRRLINIFFNGMWIIINSRCHYNIKTKKKTLQENDIKILEDIRDILKEFGTPKMLTVVGPI